MAENMPSDTNGYITPHQDGQKIHQHQLQKKQYLQYIITREKKKKRKKKPLTVFANSIGTAALK
jgi:hypothetical protein